MYRCYIEAFDLAQKKIPRKDKNKNQAGKSETSLFLVCL